MSNVGQQSSRVGVVGKYSSVQWSWARMKEEMVAWGYMGGECRMRMMSTLRAFVVLV